jgi:hypothetical protein
VKRLLVLVALLAAAPVARAGLYLPPPSDVQPAWSPDGTQLAYFGYGRGIRIVGADGSGDHAVPNAPLTPQYAFSPDWRRLAFVAYQRTPNAYTLDVMNVDGSGRRVLAQPAGAAAPAFSPDGKRVAYANADGVWVVGVDGGAPTAVEPRPATDLAWSPDGTRIAYTVSAQPPHVEAARADGSGVVDVAADGSFRPAWSPDGRTVAYFQGGTLRTGFAGAAYTLRGGRPAGRPAWSRDGLAVYYATKRLYRLDLVAGREQEIGPASPDVALAPDGATHAYSGTGDCGDRAGIYVGARRLTSDCHVYGPDRTDRLASSARLYQVVDGRGGDDVLTARGAPYVGDELDGGAGNDILRGGSLPDRLDGGAGADAIFGGVDHDTIRGGPGRDRIYGQGGSDHVYTRDGERDLVDCGTNVGRTNKTPELDRAYVDRFDVVAHCEKVFRSRG